MSNWISVLQGLPDLKKNVNIIIRGDKYKIPIASTLEKTKSGFFWKIEVNLELLDLLPLADVSHWTYIPEFDGQ